MEKIGHGGHNVSPSAGGPNYIQTTEAGSSTHATSAQYSAPMMHPAKENIITQHTDKPPPTHGTEGTTHIPAPPSGSKGKEAETAKLSQIHEAPESLTNFKYNTDAPNTKKIILNEITPWNSLNGKFGWSFIASMTSKYDKHTEANTILSQQEYLALSTYTTSLYKPINNALRGKDPDQQNSLINSIYDTLLGKDPAKEKNYWNNVIYDSDRALAKLGTSPHFKFSGTVYRGANFSPEQIKSKFKVGEVFSDKAFMSTSKDKNQAFEGNTKLKILSKSGVSIESIAVEGGEKEVLFRPDTKFLVTCATTKDGKNYIKMIEK